MNETSKKIEITWPAVALLSFALIVVLVLVLRLDMGSEPFYAAAFPWYILGFVAVAMFLMAGLVAVIAWALRSVQRSDNGSVADAARWRALAEQAKTDRAAIANPARIIEADADQVDEGDWRYQLADDGAGLDFDRIRQRAIDNQLAGADEALDEKRLTNLIFMPGFSTAWWPRS